MEGYEIALWNEIAELLEWSAPNIGSYIRDHVDDEECTGFCLKTIKGKVHVIAYGIDRKKRQEQMLDDWVMKGFKER